MGSPAVLVHHVSKRFRLGQTHDSLRDLLSNTLMRMIGRRNARNDASQFLALEDISFEVNPGEALGIIGPNGAGKSTVLRLLAGILHPDSGSINIEGRLAALIEVGAGFHGDLTGRENIFLNGAILGMSRTEVKRKLDAIVAFAGIERFLDMPVKRYSSGMYARLGFSIAAHVDPHVLLVDEVLSVGDAVFRLRCMERMRELVAHGTTLIFVTHHLEQMQAICHRTIVLEGGRAVFEGQPRDAVSRYTEAVTKAYASIPTDTRTLEGHGHGIVDVIRLRFVNDGGETVDWIHPRQGVRVELTFQLRQPVPQLVAEFNLRTSTSENLLSFNSGRDDVTFSAKPGVQTVTLSLPAIPLCGGQYFWNLRMWNAETGTTILDTPLCYPMLIDDGGRASGILAIDREWGFATSTSQIATSELGSGRPADTEHGEAHEDLLLR